MKLKNILWMALSAVALVSCDNYLDVEAPSAYTDDFIYSQKSEINRALNGVYAQALSGDLYGNAYQSTFIYNSDVEMSINSSDAHANDGYARFDCNERGSAIGKFWTAAYRLIEYANKFVRNAEASTFFQEGDTEVMQQVGEAKCLRAMAYHDLVVMFGDVPFKFAPTDEHGADYIPPVVDRLVIQATLIQDLQSIAPYMSSSKSVTVERCSREFAHALIARIALTAGGYSLRPDKENVRNYGTMVRPENYKDYYQIAMVHADSVILSNSHKLSLDYQDVFVNQCNYQVVNGDDVIFELPFAKQASGNTGYLQGPTYSAYEGETVGQWGEAKGNARLSAFYRFLFRDNDLRREFVNGLWYYSYFTDAYGQMRDTVYIRNDYTVHNNKWSKLWTSTGNALGSKIAGNTGINFPYMRYADVLLMYAEAANELNEAPTPKAVECLTEVHSRAFVDGDPTFIAEAQAGKDAFLKAVLNERKWEFAGENIRWRDLVRTNTYGEELVYSFLRYFSAGYQKAVGYTNYEDAINEHDGRVYIDRLPGRVYYHTYNIEEINEMGLFFFSNQLYGYQTSQTAVLKKYPNQDLQSLRIYNAYNSVDEPMAGEISIAGFSAKNWSNVRFFEWGNADAGMPNNQCLYSFYGYVRGDSNGNIWLIRDGIPEQLPSTIPSAELLPAVRYILPYPEEAIKRSSGVYKNYYGY